MIKADILKVTPGMLRGELSSFDAESGTGTVAISEQDDPFGDVDLDGSFHFDQDVRFEGDIDSEALSSSCGSSAGKASTCSSPSPVSRTRPAASTSTCCAPRAGGD
ncbi:MAG: hypothetical protein U1E76_16535 [Planctomycetota bacterium]